MSCKVENLHKVQKFAEALRDRQNGRVDMTRWAIATGEYFGGRSELILPEDLAELATLGYLIDRVQESYLAPLLSIPGARERFNAMQTEVFNRLGLSLEVE